jgi:hypothetical protein
MNETMPDGCMDTFLEFQASTRQFAHMITPIRKMSRALTYSDIGGDLDLVFIDGDHSEDAVRADFNIVRDNVRPGGIIAFHDVSSCYPGVNKVLGEVLASGNWRLTDFTDSLGSVQKISENE